MSFPNATSLGPKLLFQASTRVEVWTVYHWFLPKGSTVFRSSQAVQSYLEIVSIRAKLVEQIHDCSPSCSLKHGPK